MTIFYEPKILLPLDAVAPDSYEGYAGNIPLPDFVVSRYKNGNIASVYGDMLWDWSPYDPVGRSAPLNFVFWGKGCLTREREELASEIRWLIFLIIWKRPGPTISYKTLRQYLQVLRNLARFCEQNLCRLKDVLNNYKLLFNFFENDQTREAPKNIAALIYLLIVLGPEQVGFQTLGISVHNKLRSMVKKHQSYSKQYAPIPTKIYSSIIAKLQKELREFEEVEDRYFALVTECSNSPFMGRHRSIQYTKAKKLKLNRDEWKRCPKFKKLLEQYKLKEYFVSKGLRLSVQGLSRGLFQVQLVAKLTIETFSGMRIEEVLNLPFNCLETSTSSGKIHYLIVGSTTKLNDGKPEKTSWVTNGEGFRAICIAQRIAEVVYRKETKINTKSDLKKVFSPLFVSPAYLGFAKNITKKHSCNYKIPALDLCENSNKKLRERLQPIIENSDLQELERIDPHRAWSSEEKFQVGRPWTLTNHQLRRSLALYAQRSGLVSLPSLRRQLQHITDEMSRYYSRGSAYAQNFIGDVKNHFGLEWQDAQPESAALSYILNVLHSDEVLFGGHANWIKKRAHNAGGVSLIDRDETFRLFKLGQISYRETSLGGCTNTGVCKQIAIKVLDIDCISNGCTNLVGMLTKLERVICAQTRHANSLDQTSVEFRTVKAELDILTAARDKAVMTREQCREAT